MLKGAHCKYFISAASIGTEVYNGTTAGGLGYYLEVNVICPGKSTHWAVN
jgi:hypothetical protein